MVQDLELRPDTRAALDALKDFEITKIAGSYPLLAQGLVDGHYWYFHARGKSWSIEIGGTPTFNQPPIWWHDEEWRGGAVDAGGMTADEAATCVIKAVLLFRSQGREILKPGHPDYGPHLLRAWSEGFISATTVGEYFSLNVIQVVELGLAKGFPQPMTATLEVQQYLDSLAEK